MTRSRRPAPGMAARIALAALLPAAVVLGVMAAATWVLSRALFERLMVAHGATVSEAGAMFEQTVGVVALGALLAGAVIAGLVALVLARHLAEPLRSLQRTAHRLAAGDLKARSGLSPAVPELRALASAFDAMAAALERQEQVRQDFVSGAAHELLTPLTNLEGYLEGLRDGVVQATPATFESLLEEARRLTRLSRTLLEMADADQTTAQDGEAVDLARSVSVAAALVEPAFRRAHLRLDVDVPSGLQVVAAPDHVAQVLFNLLQNAGRYSRPQGVVRLSARAENGHVQVTVGNPGEQIPAESVDRLFERFYRVDPSRDRGTGGTGIGLAVVKQLVEASGGRVGVHSEPGETRFWFTLPAAASGG